MVPLTQNEPLHINASDTFCKKKKGIFILHKLIQNSARLKKKRIGKPFKLAMEDSYTLDREDLF